MRSAMNFSRKSAFTILAVIISMIALISLSCSSGMPIGIDASKGDKPKTENVEPVTPAATAKSSKISQEEAVKIALQAVPGEVTAVSIEKKLGADRYVVEVIAKEDLIETDVIIDMETGKVLDKEK